MKLIGLCVHKAKTFWGKSFLMMVSLLLVNVSCASYYLQQRADIQPLPVDQSKTVVLHQGNCFVKLESFELHDSELTGFPAGKLRSDGEPVEETTSGQVAREVHLYLDETPPLVVETGTSIVVPFSRINKVMVYHEKPEKRGVKVLKEVGLVVLVVLACAVYIGLAVLMAGGGGGPSGGK